MEAKSFQNSFRTSMVAFLRNRHLCSFWAFLYRFTNPAYNLICSGFATSRVADTPLRYLINVLNCTESFKLVNPTLDDFFQALCPSQRMYRIVIFFLERAAFIIQFHTENSLLELTMWFPRTLRCLICQVLRY